MSPSLAATRHCATARYFEAINGSLGEIPSTHTTTTTAAARAKIAAAAYASKPMADRPFARSWYTPHFALRYSLFGLHQVKFLPGDSSLLSQAAALRQSLSAQGVGAASLDSAVYAKLDSANAPHPEYVQAAAGIIEAAWAYYVDTLGMKPPRGTAKSLAYRIPDAAGNRFVIDVADIGTYSSFYDGEYYGLTFPPPNLAIILENDFLWNTRLLPSGRVAGDSVSSRLDGKVIHNYASEYGLGLRITLYHEFYHAIQFTYVSNHPRGYHAWYELSAVGMEERKVPEGNDYYQYLPCLFDSPGKFGLFDQGGEYCNPAAEYSNAPFHFYLGEKIGEDFDTRVWEHLAANQDRIEVSLPAVLSRLGTSLAKTWPDYAAGLLLSGLSSRPDQFTPDMPEWPTMQGDTLNPDNWQGDRTYQLAPVSYLPIRLPTAFEAGKVSVTFAGDSSALSLLITEDSVKRETFTRSEGLLAPWNKAGQSWLLLTNLSPTATRTVTLASTDIPFRYYPNPLRLSSHEALSFTRSTSLAFPLRIKIISENGRPLWTREFASVKDMENWDLKDDKQRPMGPGIYHLKINQESWSTLLILP